MQPDQLSFSIAPEVVNLGVTGAYLVIDRLRNREADAGFDAYRDRVLDELKPRYAGEGFLRDDPVLAGFRELHARVGRSNRRFVAAPEALVSRFIRTGTLPHLNLLVDIYNLISLQTRLALGAHDVACIEGSVALRLTDGSEGFHPLGAAEPEPVFPGEYGYIDGNNDVICRLEVLQVEKTKIGLDTTAAFYIVQGNMNTPASQVVDAVSELVERTKQFCGGRERMLYTPS